MIHKLKTFMTMEDWLNTFNIDDHINLLQEAAKKADIDIDDHINLLQEAAARKQYFVFLRILEDLNYRTGLDKEDFSKQPLKDRLLDSTYDLNQLSEEDKEIIMQNNFQE